MAENTFNPIEGAEDFALAPTAPAEQAQIVMIDDEDHFIADLTTAKKSYCSMVMQTNEDRAKLFNAVNCTQERIADHVGEEITLSDIYIETVRCTNEETGATKAAPRIIMIAEDGTTYQCVSVGIFSALRKLFTIFGTPDEWTTPRRIKFRQINRGAFRILTFDVIA